MHAQLIESTTSADRVDELSEVIRRELLVALRRQEGFSGALSLLDRETGTGLLVVLWETGEEAARPLVRAVRRCSPRWPRWPRSPPASSASPPCGRSPSVPDPPALRKTQGVGHGASAYARAERWEQWIGEAPIRQRNGEDWTCTA